VIIVFYRTQVIGVKLSDEELEMLESLKYQKVIEKDSVKRQAYTKSLDQHFKDTKSKQERNSAILEAINDGYAQIEVAKYLNVSRSLVSKIVKENEG